MISGLYEYKGVNDAGSMTRGEVSADNWDDAYRAVTSLGLTPVKIKPASGRRRRASGGGGGKITLRELSQFTHQFAVLMEARIPVANGLRSIAEEEANPQLRSVIQQIASSVGSGSTITESLSPHRKMFGDVYIETVYAAEQSGNLAVILEHLASMLEDEIETRASLRSAMIYPVCVIVALLGAVVFLLVTVVPRFVTMFESRGIALPLPTRILITVSSSLTGYWWAWLLAVGTVAFGVWKLRSTARGQIWLDRGLHKIPVCRSALQAAALSRFAQVLGVSLQSGLNLIEALRIAGRASGRPMLQRDANVMADALEQGGRLTDAVGSCPYMTGFARRLVSAGEQSADLPAMCEIINRHYQREMKYLTKNIATIIEPVVVVLLAGVVLTIALSIFLPMWDGMSVIG